MKKRKQHYVWEHYLASWATHGQVWSRRAGRSFKASTDNAAQQRDFYRLKEMSDEDVALVRRLIDGMAAVAQSTALSWVGYFRIFHQLRALWIQSGKADPEVEAELDEAINNMEEDMHADIEARAVPILAALRRGDGAFLDDDDAFIDFARFIAAQYFRTSIRKDGVLRALAEFSHVFNADAAWSVLRTIFADHLGAFMFVNLVFLEPTHSELVTGAQPIVNADEKAGAADAQNLRLYYPVSPGRAILLDWKADARVVETRELSEPDVGRMNALIARESNDQIYARSEATLRDVPVPA